MHAFIYTTVDYGNAIYAGLFFSNINQPQSALNGVTWLISGPFRFRHIPFQVGETASVIYAKMP